MFANFDRHIKTHRQYVTEVIRTSNTGIVNDRNNCNNASGMDLTCLMEILFCD